MNKNQLKIGIILGSTREGRVSPFVGDYVKKIADQRTEATFEIVDIKEYNLPFVGTSSNLEMVNQWNKKLDELDGFIFIVAEYNHSITGALKNALDLSQKGLNNKPAGIVSYGSAGGARASEHLRGVLAEFQVADVRTHTLISIFTDFTDGKFTPRAMHQKNIDGMLDQLFLWGTALKQVR